MKISKQFLTALLVFLSLGCFALLLSVFLPSAQPSSKEGSVTLSDRAQNAFSSVEIENASGNYTITYDGEGYHCDQLKGLPLSTDAFDELAQECTSLTAWGPLEQPKDPDSPAPDYGFDLPLARAEAVYSDGGGILIEVGSQIAGTDQYYIRVNGSQSVYRIDRASIRYLLAEPSVYLDLSLAPSRSDGTVLPSSIKLTTGEESIELERLRTTQTDGAGFSYNYRLVGPRPYYVDPDAFKTYFGDLNTLKATDVVTLYPTEVELREYGLSAEQPRSVLSFTVLGEQVTLRIGDFSGSFYYVYREGVPAVYRLSALAVTWEGADEYALMTRYLMTPDPDTLREIRVEGTGVSAQFVKTSTGWNWNGDPLSGETFDSFYRLLCSLRAEYEIEDPVQNILPEMTVTFVYDEPTGEEEPEYRTDVIRFVPYGIKRHAIEINGEARYAVRSTYVSAILSALSGLWDGQVLNLSW